MTSRVQSILLILFICGFTLIVLLDLAAVPQTPAWLLPLSGGVLVGIGVAAQRQSADAWDWKSLVTDHYAEPPGLIALGSLIIVVGRLFV